eukprot:809082-Pleurochrysis_carterae.AAC.5
MRSPLGPRGAGEPSLNERARIGSSSELKCPRNDRSSWRNTRSSSLLDPRALRCGVGIADGIVTAVALNDYFKLLNSRVQGIAEV